MVALIQDRDLNDDLIEDRRARGIDRYDEVWEGIYVMAPMTNNEHQFFVKELTLVLGINVDWAGLGQTFPGVNVSDRPVDWMENFRVPDVAVFLNDTAAKNCGTFWFGGPDLAIEIQSDGEQPLAQLDFYASVGTRELLVVQRDPWKLKFFRLSDGRLLLAGQSDFNTQASVPSSVVPLSWRLVSDDRGLALVISHQDRDQSWRVRIDA